MMELLTVHSLQSMTLEWILISGQHSNSACIVRMSLLSFLELYMFLLDINYTSYAYRDLHKLFHFVFNIKSD